MRRSVRNISTSTCLVVVFELPSGDNLCLCVIFFGRNVCHTTGQALVRLLDTLGWGAESDLLLNDGSSKFVFSFYFFL